MCSVPQTPPAAISWNTAYSLVFVKEPRSQIAFGYIAKRLPKYSLKRARGKFLVYGNRKRLMFTGRQNPPQFRVAPTDSEHRKSKIAQSAQNFARRHPAKVAHQAAGTS